MLTGVVSWFNEHPVIKFLTVVGGLVGLGATFATFIYDEKIEAANARLEQTKLDYKEDIAELEASLSNIERTIGGKTDVLDVGAILVDQDEAAELARAKYYATEGYYAIDERANSEWTEREISEWQLLVDTFGAETAKQYEDYLRERLGRPLAPRRSRP